MRNIAQEPDELRRDLFQETAVAMRVHQRRVTQENPMNRDLAIFYAFDFL